MTASNLMDDHHDRYILELRNRIHHVVSGSLRDEGVLSYDQVTAIGRAIMGAVDEDDVTIWARETQEAARAGKFDLRDLGRAMNGRWDQDFPAKVLDRLSPNLEGEK